MFEAGQVTVQRMVALERLSDKFSLSNVVVFLLEGNYLKASYTQSCKQELIDSLVDLKIDLDIKSLQKTSPSEEYLELSIKNYMSKCERYPKSYMVQAFSLPDDLVPDIGTKAKKVGAIVYQSNGNTIDKADLDLFALSISASRDHRIVEAVKVAQEHLRNGNSAEVDDILIRVASILQRILGAEQCYYMNSNKFLSWQLINSKKGGLETQFENIELVAEASLPEHSILEVPLVQTAYELNNKPFAEANVFLPTLTKTDAQPTSLLFFNKQNPGYLQTSFSETDKIIAESVFGYLAHFSSARIFQSNYQNVLQFLQDHSDVQEMDLTEILQLLQSLSIAIVNVFYLSAEFVGGEINIETTETANDETQLSADYLDRLKSRYLEKFYNGFKDTPSEGLQLGFDKTEGGYDIEFHFPSKDGSSQLYIVRFARNTITESVFQSLISFFSELHVRTRNQAVERGRADYLTQVRHAVIHHFSAANKWMYHLVPRWNKGVKYANYWGHLHKDPIVSKSLKRSLWSLTQARLLLENGRFLLKDIEAEKLNRKAFSIVSLIKDAFTSLDDQREQKAVVIKSSIQGQAPGLMNADEPLMRIAIFNLVDNALKYSPNQKMVSWSLVYKDDQYEFSISNTGSHISDAEKKLIRQIGVRGRQRDHLNQRHGTGLGIPVTSKIIKAHRPGYDLEISSIPISDETGNVDSSKKPRIAINTFSFKMPYLTGLSNPGKTTDV